MNVPIFKFDENNPEWKERPVNDLNEACAFKVMFSLLREDCHKKEAPKRKRRKQHEENGDVKKPRTTRNTEELERTRKQNHERSLRSKKRADRSKTNPTGTKRFNGGQQSKKRAEESEANFTETGHFKFAEPGSFRPQKPFKFTGSSGGPQSGHVFTNSPTLPDNDEQATSTGKAEAQAEEEEEGQASAGGPNGNAIQAKIVVHVKVFTQKR